MPKALADIEAAHEMSWQAARDGLNAARDRYVVVHKPLQVPIVYKVGDKVWLSTQCLVPPELRRVEHKDHCALQWALQGPQGYL